MELIVINLIISSLTLILGFLDKQKFKHIEACCCIESDCVNGKTEPNTPICSPPMKETYI